MCHVLNVRESGYYSWLKKKDIPGKRKHLSVVIKEIIEESPENKNYGIERIGLALA